MDHPHSSIFQFGLVRSTCICLCSQSELVERSVTELVDTLRSGLSPEQRVNLTADEGYACVQPDTKNKKQRCQDCQPCCYYSLLNYFTQRNTEALVKC